MTNKKETCIQNIGGVDYEVTYNKINLSPIQKKFKVGYRVINTLTKVKGTVITVSCNHFEVRYDSHDADSFLFNISALSCFKVIKDDHAKCQRCGVSFDKKDVIYHNSSFYCKDCYDELFFECDDCGELLSSHFESTMDGVCETCYDKNYFICYECKVPYSGEYTQHEHCENIYCRSCVADVTEIN